MPHRGKEVGPKELNDAAVIIEHAHREADEIRAAATREVEALRAKAVEEVQAVNATLVELQDGAMAQMRDVEQKLEERRRDLVQHAAMTEAMEVARAEMATLTESLEAVREEAAALIRSRDAAVAEKAELTAQLESLVREVESEAAALLSARGEIEKLRSGTSDAMAAARRQAIELVDDIRKKAAEEAESVIADAVARGGAIVAQAQTAAREATEKARNELDAINDLVLTQRRKAADEKASLAASLEAYRREVQAEKDGPEVT